MCRYLLLVGVLFCSFAQADSIEGATHALCEQFLGNLDARLIEAGWDEETVAKLTPSQRQAVYDAHRVGRGKPGRDGGPARIGNYTLPQLKEKIRILREAKIPPAQRRSLAKAGIIGETVDEAGFIAAINESPNDWVLKLVYADWLEERGDPRYEWIRLSSDIATPPVELDTAYFNRLGKMQKRQRQMEDEYVRQRFGIETVPAGLEITERTPIGIPTAWTFQNERAAASYLALARPVHPELAALARPLLQDRPLRENMSRQLNLVLDGEATTPQLAEVLSNEANYFRSADVASAHPVRDLADAIMANFHNETNPENHIFKEHGSSFVAQAQVLAFVDLYLSKRLTKVSRNSALIFLAEYSADGPGERRHLQRVLAQAEDNYSPEEVSALRKQIKKNRG